MAALQHKHTRAHTHTKHSSTNATTYRWLVNCPSFKIITTTAQTTQHKHTKQAMLEKKGRRKGRRRSSSICDAFYDNQTDFSCGHLMMWFIFEILALNYRSFALIYSFRDGWCCRLRGQRLDVSMCCAWPAIWLIYRLGFCFVYRISCQHFDSRFFFFRFCTEYLAYPNKVHTSGEVEERCVKQKKATNTKRTIFSLPHIWLPTHSTYMATVKLKFHLMVNVYTFQIVYHTHLSSIPGAHSIRTHTHTHTFRRDPRDSNNIVRRETATTTNSLTIATFYWRSFIC